MRFEWVASDTFSVVLALVGSVSRPTNSEKVQLIVAHWQTFFLMNFDGSAIKQISKVTKTATTGKFTVAPNITHVTPLKLTAPNLNFQ